MLGTSEKTAMVFATQHVCGRRGESEVPPLTKSSGAVTLYARVRVDTRI